MSDFHGAKTALLSPRGLIVLRRDDIPTIPWPGRVDFPGGGREKGESPLDCARRELREELGLTLPPDRFHWGRGFGNSNGLSWLFAAHVTGAEVDRIVLGEGQAWWCEDIVTYLARDDAIPTHQARLTTYLNEVSTKSKTPGVRPGA